MPCSIGAHRDDSRFSEHFEVVGQGCLGEFQVEFVAGPLAVGGKPYDPKPYRITERLQDIRKRHPISDRR